MLPWNNDDNGGKKKKEESKLVVGFVLESVLWRANPDWLKKLGYYDVKEEESKILNDTCFKGIKILEEIQMEYPTIPMIKSGTVGPRSDGYIAERIMTVNEAKNSHLPQIQALKIAGADIITGITINYINEGIGFALAAKQVGIPCVLSFTVETNGCLMNGGESIQEIIETIDKETYSYPAYYMINCAHLTHFCDILSKAAAAATTESDENDDNNKSCWWLHRIGGIRANASKLSHAELDNCETLDEGNPIEFGQEYQQLMKILPNLNVVGGCCGTNHNHVSEIIKCCAKPFNEMRGKKKDSKSN